MGLGIVRLGDQCSGHGGFPSRPNFSGSPDVFVNGIGVHRVGDQWPIHCDGHSCHDGILVSGSSSVFANGLGVGRIGDQINCGSICQVGSSDVFAGG